MTPEESPPSRQPLFLEQRRYRLRRVIDIAYLLPLVGLILILLPVLKNPAETEAKETAGATIYVFGIWIGLVIAAYFVARALRRLADDADRAEDGDPR